MSLLEIDNLSYLNELLPESVARERNVLIVSNIDDQLTLIHPDRGFGEDDRKIVEYILDRPLLWISHKLDEIRTAVHVAYGTVEEVKGCEWKFATQCPKRWNNLERTEQYTVRHCGVCNKLVHLCWTESQEREHTKRGNGVCFVSDQLYGESGHEILQQFNESAKDLTDDADASASDTGKNAG